VSQGAEADSVMGVFARNDILQVLLFAILFGFSC
jgi:Na+/H+-dicarboxylate symporter